MTEAQTRLVALDKKKEEVKKFYEELTEATRAVAAELGVGGHFQDSEGIVYQVIVPDGKFVKFESIGYQRTKRPHEARGELSKVKAKELGYNID